MNEAICKLLTIGAISECTPCNDQFVSSIFLTPKPGGDFRFILNLKALNKFIDTDHFKIEDLRTVLKLISEGDFMCTIDLKDAYLLIKIHPQSRKFLRLIWQNKLYEFNVLPFGYNRALYIFTKLIKPIVRLLRLAGFLSSVYLDDFFLIDRNNKECLNNTNTTKKLLIALGFIINDEKSKLITSVSCKYLGFVINSQEFKITLPTDKKVAVKLELQKFIQIKRCKIRKFAQLVGILVAACPAVEYGWLYTKQLERCKFLNLRGGNDYEKHMNIPSSILPDLTWWLEAIDNAFSSIKVDEYQAEIFTDASTTGWGAAYGPDSTGGKWSGEEQKQHINSLELRAAFFGLKCFAKNFKNCQILMRIDNSTAISYINRMGGIKYPHLNRIARDIWQWGEARKIFIVASYIKSADNQVADAKSRRVHPDIEWSLTATAFDKIVLKFRRPQVDLFADRLNKKCAKYVAWQRDPDAFEINAFPINWSKFYFYAFPPFSIILKVLRKIILDKARGIVIVPVWPNQPWFPIFKGLLQSDTISLIPNKDIIISNFSNRQIHSHLTLVAGILSGRDY